MQGLDFPDNLMHIFGLTREEQPMTMKQATIANDVCRCHDEDCAERSKCKRYVERALGTGERISHAETLYIVCDGECANFIGVE